MLRKSISQLVNRALLPKNPYDGELLLLERLRLYQWIRSYAPRIVLEVGTGVGGSTFYISEALREFGGILYSCDPHRQPPPEFLERFRGTLHYKPWTSEELIGHLAATGLHPDFVFFDGPELPDLALRDIRTLEQHAKDGCLFAMHDWEQAGGRNPAICSVKAAKIRPYLEASPSWQQVGGLHGHRKNVWWTRGRFDSVGLCLFQFRAPSRSAAEAA